jgi:hypothetical protein
MSLVTIRSVDCFIQYNNAKHGHDLSLNTLSSNRVFSVQQNVLLRFLARRKPVDHDCAEDVKVFREAVSVL